MNCPFTHTSCDKECAVYNKFGDSCMFENLVITFLETFPNLLLREIKPTKEKPNAKSTRKKAKSPSKEKRTRKATD